MLDVKFINEKNIFDVKLEMKVQKNDLCVVKSYYPSSGILLLI